MLEDMFYVYFTLLYVVSTHLLYFPLNSIKFKKGSNLYP